MGNFKEMQENYIHSGNTRTILENEKLMDISVSSSPKSRNQVYAPLKVCVFKKEKEKKHGKPT